MITELTQQTFNETVAQENAPVLVDYYSTSCGPCRALVPTLERLSTDYSIAKVNVGEHNELAIDANIKVVPTLVFYKGGKEVKRLTGLQTEQALRDAFQSVQ